MAWEIQSPKGRWERWTGWGRRRPQSRRPLEWDSDKPQSRRPLKWPAACPKATDRADRPKVRPQGPSTHTGLASLTPDFCTEIDPKPAKASSRSFTAKLRSGRPQGRSGRQTGLFRRPTPCIIASAPPGPGTDITGPVGKRRGVAAAAGATGPAYPTLRMPSARPALRPMTFSMVARRSRKP